MENPTNSVTDSVVEGVEFLLARERWAPANLVSRLLQGHRLLPDYQAFFDEAEECRQVSTARTLKFGPSCSRTHVTASGQLSLDQRHT